MMFEFMRKLFGIPTAYEIEQERKEKERRKTQQRAMEMLNEDSDQLSYYIIIDDILNDTNESDDWEKIEEDLDIDTGDFDYE